MHRMGNEKDPCFQWVIFFLSRVKKPCGGHWRGTASQSALAELLWPVSWSLLLHLQSIWCCIFSCALCHQGAPGSLCTLSAGRVSLCWLTTALAKIVPQGINPKGKCLRFFVGLCLVFLVFYLSQIVPTVNPGQSEIPERSIWNGFLYKAIMTGKSWNH